MAGKTLPSSSGDFNKAMLNILDSDTPKTAPKSTSTNAGKKTGNTASKSTGGKKK